MTPAQVKKSRSQGYLPKEELRGAEIPLFDLAHELYHAANGRATFSRARRRAFETAADTHANKTLDEFRRSREAIKSETWNVTPATSSP